MPDTNDLLQSKVASRDPRINAVGQPIVAFSHRFDNGRGVHACTCFKGVLAKHRVVAWKRDLDVFVRLLHVGIQKGQVVVDDTHQLEVDKGLVERRVARSLSDTEGRAVNHIGTGFNRSDVVRHAKSSVLVAVPVDLDVSALIASILDDLFINEGEEFLHTVWRDVATCVANAEPSNTEFHGSLIDHLHIFGIRTGRVLGDKHHRDVVLNSV